MTEAMAVETAHPHPPTRTLHEIAGRDAWPWLPTQHNGTLARHPLCANCGRVKFLGTRRAQDLGGLVNLLGRLARKLERAGRPLTEAQRRLIVRSLQAREADDTFSLSHESQIRIFTAVVAQHLGLEPTVLETYAASS